MYSPFLFLKKCSLFHNSNVFGACVIHILYTGCAKIKKKNNSGAKRLSCIADNDVPVRRIDTSLAPSVLHYFVKGLNSFKIYYAAREIESGILTAQSAGLLNAGLFMR